MATYTENYHLSKPETTDSQQSFIEDYATNMEIIDENMGGGSGGGGHVIIDENGTEVAQEPKMQFAGKVSVADDATNEKTVVTLPEEVKEVTLAEYEALPDTKLTDDIAYFIKDVDDESVEGYPPLIYSDEEREVGVWRDGKPLYQKTIHHVNTTSSFEDYVTITTISNIDTVASIDTVVRRQLESNSLWFSVPARPENGDSYRFSVAVRTYNDAVQYRIDQYGTQITDMYITIRYTKTTDTAGSGTWNGQGGLAHHYSTNETVIGTWIDGKPLYERTISYISSTSAGVHNIETLTNVDNIVSMQGIGIYQTQKIPIPYYGGNNDFYLLWTDGANLQEYRGSANGFSGTQMYVTIQYTKTTD